MPKGYFIRCSDCGYLYECEEDLLECLEKHICEHCGSSNMEVIQQQEGRFGCTSRLNTHAVNADLHPDFP